MTVRKGLIIRDPWVSDIFNGMKTWEIRGSKTSVRGRIAIIKSGTKKIYGYVDLVDCVGPLTVDWMFAESRKHLIHNDFDSVGLPYKKTYGWVLENPKLLTTPISYNHPHGAVIWVNLIK